MEHINRDVDDLAALGYKQELTRSLGSFSSFAAGFSYLSIMSGMFQLFAFGFGFAGPLVWWAWIAVFAGMMLVALCFAETSAQFPIAGSVYSWASRQGSEAWGWMTGWIMLIASIATVAGVAVAWQISLPAISPFFQFVGDGNGKYDFAENAVLLGLILLVLITIANVAGIRIMSRTNNLGVMAEITGVSLFIGLMLAHVHRGPSIVMHSLGMPAASKLGIGGAILIAAIMPGWVMFGFDTAGSLAEETHDPRRRAPRAILTALAAGGGGGLILLLLSLMAASDLHDPKVASQGLPYIVQTLLGAGIGKAMLVFVVISTAAGALAIQTATIRFVFAMARDGKLPFSKRLSHVNPKTHTPVTATVGVAVLVALILIATARQPQIFTVLTSVSVVLVYIAYAMALAAHLRSRRVQDGVLKKVPGHFSLGRWGLAINIAALLFLILGAINFVWPRPQIYGAGAYRWGGVIFVAATLGGGLIYRRFRHAPVATELSEHQIVDKA